MLDKSGEQENRDREFAEEAERVATLPLDVQRRLVADQQAIADDPKVPKRDRDYARERAAALKRHLRRLNRQKNRKGTL